MSRVMKRMFGRLRVLLFRPYGLLVRFLVEKSLFFCWVLRTI